MLELLKSIPAILSMLFQLKKLWDEYLESNERREKMNSLSDALKAAREEKDTTKVENLLRDIISKP